jgi:hypothetical protein
MSRDLLEKLLETPERTLINSSSAADSQTVLEGHLSMAVRSKGIETPVGFRPKHHSRSEPRSAEWGTELLSLAPLHRGCLP